jgi:surfeit locus 1 family protein
MFKRLVLSRPVATIAALIVCWVALSLGFWQLDRMQQKIDLAQDIALLANAKAWSLDEVKHHRMIAKGTYWAEKSIWLENRPHPQGRDPQTGVSTGFYVMTPLVLENSQIILWVNRGWAPRDGLNREKLPEISTPSGVVQIEGLVFEHPARVMSMGMSGVSAETQKIQQNLDIQKQSHMLGMKNLPFILRESASSVRDGLQRNWPLMQTGVEKHQGYAFQWFSLAVLTIIFWLLTGILRK